MKKSLLILTTSLTLLAGGTSFHLATLPTPTDAQKNLSTTTNAIALAGTAALFGLLDNDDEQNAKK
jgi:hypothetical protein